jgi:hypothetical protein
MKQYNALGSPKMLYDSRGSFSTGTHIEIQVTSAGNGYFRVYFTDGYKFLNSGKVVRLHELKREIRAFKALK